MAGRLDDEGPRHDPDDDRWRPVQDVGDEPHPKTQPSRSVFGQVQPRTDADRHADQRGNADDDPSPHDGVGDTATGLSCRDRALGEERPIDGRRALRDQVAEDEHEREHGGKRQDDDDCRHQSARQVAPKRTRAHSARLPTAAPRATRQIRMRAMAFTATVTTKRMRPTSMRADWYVAVVASLNSFAIAAAIVYAGC